MNPSKNFLAPLRRIKVGAPLALLLMLAMLVLPLPPAVLDTLFVFNIALAIVVILVSVTVRRPLEFSAFPTIILGATLMRLMLNVASTRVVLLNGHEGTDAAGRVIEAFGHVVIGGNFVVGLVVFVILMIINFVVVTKGAERISEVSARFTLDALPGKQMAIDADLNAGLITQDQAQQRRAEVAAEADFYGAMDGASKFVRGDAIAGILVLVINLVGGLLIGMAMNGMGFADAFQQYGLLTIGDGLVAQIPALLLSAAAAIIVTRISSSGDMEQQLGQQLLASPSVMYGTAGLLLLLAMLPGMPGLLFLAFAALLGYLGWRLQRGGAAVEAPDPAREVEATLLSAPPAALDWASIPYVETLSVALGYKLIGLIDEAQGAPLLKRLRGMRQNLSENLGFLVPPIGARSDLSQPPAQYSVLMAGAVVAQGQVHANRLMAIPSAKVYGELDGIPDVDPAYEMQVTWIEPERKAHALGLGYQVVDCSTVIATHLAKVVSDNLQDLFTYDDVAAMLERLSAQAPVLGEALGKALSHGQLRRVFGQLLAENVSLKDIRGIASALVEAAEGTKDPVLLAAEVRCALRRQIVAGIFGQRRQIHGFGLGSELEGLLLGALSSAESSSSRIALDNFPIDPNVLTQLQLNMPATREQMKQQGLPPVLLVIPRLRPILARYARLFAPGLNVLSYNEIPDGREVSLVGTLG
ncbi:MULTISPECIES: flagellar biosynthesis protein FlhA [Pseudoxanthomonas]|jgi:Flagellar biosynthesis pathway, component FlhA|uniref:Flagellar biosynthesis protein FlhA n=1 Tax=Pseudoxanthomonas taiwanensis J19 TaxID=935569 RepID=A0A562E6Z4_9GAMM|nr:MULTISPECIES: flagellar biosynthesis protein FlhA [Pseudoxanthomonas]RRN81022.1 flagellar biosynthesis protein FlhA [Pseudoxanthomonas sp. SGD-10]TWH17567.1 flagellar biosynthesis protein FlhA [Pseudoxanthomonas taiwanensis J19]